MGEVQIQGQQEPMIANSPTPLMGCGGGDHHIHIQKQKQPINVPNSATTMNDQSQEPIGNIDDSVLEPTNLFSMLRLNSSNAAHFRQQPPCAATNNSMKRRSPSSSPSGGEPSAKKLFYDQDDLTLHGFSAISLPVCLGTFANERRSCPVLRRCVSDPYQPPADLPEHATPPPRGSGLPPLPFRRSVSDLTPSPAKAFSRSLSSEETAPDSMRLRRMKDRLREMRQWWDEVMKDAEEKEDKCAITGEDKIPSTDGMRGDSEEAVSVELADKCVNLTFRCPCGKGYEVLLSANNCFYKLV